MKHLKGQGLLERTIFVIMGDHGKHLASTIPIILCTIVIVIMRIWKPRPSSTNLPFLNQGYLGSHQPCGYLADPPWCDENSFSPRVFDGESLFNYKLRQKSIFFYGYEESISSLDAHLIKVQYSFKKKKCWAFDLKLDPEERNPLDCSLYPLQIEALHRFASDHDSSLLEYNSSLRGKKRISGD